MDEFHEADGTPKRLEQKRYCGPGDDELPMPEGQSHVWTEGVVSDGLSN
jgi:hypothetical protein